MNKTFAFTFAATLGMAVVASADDAKSAANLPPASTKSGITYATDIKPIFDRSCVRCHSGDKPRAKLKLDTLEGVLQGDKDGKVVVVGNSAKSDLVLAVAHQGDPDDWMPPKKAEAKFPPLTADQIGLIRAWIDQGAK